MIEEETCCDSCHRTATCDQRCDGCNRAICEECSDDGYCPQCVEEYGSVGAEIGESWAYDD